MSTPWTAARQTSLSITISRSVLKLMSIESVMPSNHLILRRPLLLPPSIFPSIRVFFNESALRIRWPKDWSFSISPSNEYSGLISFRMDWLDLLAVQGTLKSLLQQHSSKASILWRLSWTLLVLWRCELTPSCCLTASTLFTLLHSAHQLPLTHLLEFCWHPLFTIVSPSVCVSLVVLWALYPLKVKGKVKLLSCVWLLATPWIVAYQAPSSMGFSRQEY